MFAFDRFDFDHNGRKFRAELVPDEDSGPPWDNEVTLGKVSDWTRYHKEPGQRVLNAHGDGRRYYDFAGAVAAARKEGMSGKDAAQAAETEYKYLRAWCDDQWRYVGVIVFPLTEDRDELRSKQESLWGIGYAHDKASDEYVREVAHDLAAQCLHYAAER